MVSLRGKSSATTKSLFPLRWVLLLIPHFKTSESMAFSICHAQIRPLTSNDSAIDTVTIPALPQYQDYIANISQQEGNTSSRELDDCNQKQWRRILHHLKKQQLWIVNVHFDHVLEVGEYQIKNEGRAFQGTGSVIPLFTPVHKNAVLLFPAQTDARTLFQVWFLIWAT